MERIWFIKEKQKNFQKNVQKKLKNLKMLKYYFMIEGKIATRTEGLKHEICIEKRQYNRAFF